MTVASERSWLRPLGLLVLVLALSVGQALLLILVPFALLAILVPAGGIRLGLLGVLAGVAAFLGPGPGGLWFVERGWTLLAGGWFVAVTLAWPARAFFPRALVALGGSLVWAAGLLLALDGWARIDWLVEGRIQRGASATLEVLALLSGGEGGGTALRETVQRTAEIQAGIFPALLGLSTLAGLGVAWWFYLKLGTDSDQGLGPLRNFRFPDSMVWLLIAGLLLVMAAGWSTGWGRLGANLAVFMGALYMLRGGAVLLFLTGGIGIPGALLLGVGLVLAAPVLLAGALMVGLGDSWMDLRARARRSRGDDTGRP